jgi:hypothetical protein
LSTFFDLLLKKKKKTKIVIASCYRVLAVLGTSGTDERNCFHPMAIIDLLLLHGSAN